MTRVVISFEVNNDQKHIYNQDVNNILDILGETGYNNIEVKEEEYSNNILANKTVSVEIDSELFFNEVSMDTKSWAYDYDDLSCNEKVYDYISCYYADELKALKNKEIDYIEVYSDY